ncbi:hypothetical protein [Paenibacillus sp. FSL L8-0709]|uniref:hypothetical protein n=1 Tax=Paenibacillus sp. FSL L8-0709 TaxID=2975312 RepID=UPI0030FA7846
MKDIIEVKCSKCGSKAQKVGGSSWPKCCGLIMILDIAEQTIIIDPEGEYSFLGGNVIKIDPANSGFFNPFEIGESPQINLKDVLDAHGELKPFDILSNEIGCTLEQYKKAEEIFLICKDNGISMIDVFKI